MPELNPSPQTQSGKQDGGRETPVVINTEPTPQNPSPKFPIGVKPELSPNPALTYVKQDGGRGAPVITTTEPKKQEETGGSSFDPSYLEAEIALKEDSANKSSSIGATPSEVKFPTEKAVADYVQSVVLGAIERSY